jgi:hypothetical protein
MMMLSGVQFLAKAFFQYFNYVILLPLGYMAGGDEPDVNLIEDCCS